MLLRGILGVATIVHMDAENKRCKDHRFLREDLITLGVWKIAYMSYSLHSSKGGYIMEYLGDYYRGH